MSRPPGPYSYLNVTYAVSKQPGTGFVYLIDANGRKIGALWGTPAEKIALAEWITTSSERELASTSLGDLKASSLVPESH